MFLLHFYRCYLAVAAGAAVYVWYAPRVWLWVLTSVVFRVLWALAAHLITRIRIERDFKTHAYAFKQQCGPYGIRLIKQAEKDFHIKKSLHEVFTGNLAKVKKNLETLEMMQTLFQAGMRPSGDDYILYDCKISYARHRLSKEKS
jgi:hypothetical protein